MKVSLRDSATLVIEPETTLEAELCDRYQFSLEHEVEMRYMHARLTRLVLRAQGMRKTAREDGN